MKPLIAGEMTHVATVQSWECDSNRHLNVQFFHQRFREAGYHFRIQHGLSDTPMVSAHTRFFRELHADDTGRVLTLPVRDAGGAVFLMHQLTVDGHAACSITLDRLKVEPPELAVLPLADFPQAGSRGLSASRVDAATDTQTLLAAGGAEVTCITHVLPEDMDHAGQWRAERLVSSFSNGGQSVWNLIQATTPWLRERNLGRVVLEMKFENRASPAPGAVLRQVSFPKALKGKTFQFGHQIEDALSGEVYAAGEVLSVLMDLTTRKVVPLPPELGMPGAT